MNEIWRAFKSAFINKGETRDVVALRVETYMALSTGIIFLLALLESFFSLAFTQIYLILCVIGFFVMVFLNISLINSIEKESKQEDLEV